MQDWLVLPDKPWAVATAFLPEQALTGIQGWQQTYLNGQPVTIVPHDHATWRLLRSRGLLVPSPTCRYGWVGPKDPMQHQKSTVDFLIGHERGFCLNGLRTGKTLSALWAADYLLDAKIVRRVLIVCPKFLMDIVWERELFMSLPHRRRALLRGDRKRKQMIARDKRIEFIVVNPESLHLIEPHLVDVDLIIVDEFTTFKSVYVGQKQSVRYAALKRASQNRMLWMLSGTPNPQDPTDAYGPIRLINPKYITLTEFRDMTTMKVSETKRVPRFGAHKIVADWLQPAIRFRREDCIDIPDVEFGEVECGLTSQQKKVIEELTRHAKARIGEGEEVAAAHAAAVMLKILQVMAGGVYGDDPNGERPTYKVDATPFMETIAEVVREDDGPVLVFANFQCSVDAISDYLQAQGLRVGSLTRGKASINGQTVKSMQLFDAFHKHGTLDGLVAVPQTMRYGLELTRGHTTMWATPPFSYETYDQANARTQGPSQKRKVMILHLVQNAMAKMLFARLKEREKFQNDVLSIIEAATEL